MKCWIALMFCSILFSCQSEKLKSGKELDHILFDRIILTDDDPYVFEKNDSTRIFYLIRHAEKDTVKNDPALSEKGIKRSDRIDNIFKKTRIDEVYSTMTTRTLMTVQEVVAAKGLQIFPYDPQKLEEFSRTLLNDPKFQTVLVVGHSNTTPALFSLLSGQESPVTINEEDYGYLFVIIKDGSLTKDAFYLQF